MINLISRNFRQDRSRNSIVLVVVFFSSFRLEIDQKLCQELWLEVGDDAARTEQISFVFEREAQKLFLGNFRDGVVAEVVDELGRLSQLLCQVDLQTVIHSDRTRHFVFFAGGRIVGSQSSWPGVVKMFSPEFVDNISGKSVILGLLGFSQMLGQLDFNKSLD
jgi:hypothetical protein